MSEHHDGYRAFPADGHEVRWTTWDGAHTETVTLRWENEGWTVTGSVGREDVDYVLRLSPLWQVRQFLLFRDLEDPDLWLGTDGAGRWGEMNGAHRPDLDGAHDLALDITPFTLSLPIKRHPLHVDDRLELPVLHIDVETLAIVPRTVVHERLAPFAWRITDDAGGSIEVEVDEHGLVRDVDGRFRRNRS
jgi:hypothetical protein